MKAGQPWKAIDEDLRQELVDMSEVTTSNCDEAGRPKIGRGWWTILTIPSDTTGHARPHPACLESEGLCGQRG